MKKLIAFLLCAALLLALCACADSGSGNNLFDNASPTTSGLQFLRSSGKSSTSSWLFDSIKTQSLLNDLSKVTATPVEDWTPKKADFPVYGLNIMDTSGNPIEAAWTKGHLILQDGSVYKFNYDFSTLEKNYDWEDTREIPYIPCQYYLTRNEGQWYSKFLTPAEHEAPPEYISMELLSVESGGITVCFTNTGSKEWIYGEAFSLDVLVDGQWYAVPVLPDKNYGFTSIGYPLHPGTSAEKTFYLGMHGALPSGTYRLVVDGLTAEFSR